jgi:lipid-A-disaccharide synthase
MKKNRKIMLVVGEASGDSHAAKLIASLRRIAPQTEFEFFGATGKKMREAGAETIVRADDFARVGIVEVATALPMFWRIFRRIKRTALARQPDAVILVDFPDFNLRLAAALKKKGLKIIYYVSPQVWAWKKFRTRTIKKYVDLLLAILPFEKDWYAARGVHNVRYVGNPLAGEVAANLSKAEFCRKHGLDETKPVIALLPGSRRTEIQRNLPELIETAYLMSREDETLQFVIALARVRKFSEAEREINVYAEKHRTPPPDFLIVRDETYEALNAADAAAVSSGTATLETALIGTPLAIVYKVSGLTYAILRNFISVEAVGLVNLVAGEKPVREFIQRDFTAENLSRELFRLLEPEVNAKMRLKLKEIGDSLGDGGASNNAARAILEELER